MNTQLTNTELVEQCISDFNSARKHTVRGALLWYEIKKRGAWRGYAESEAEFIQMTLRYNPTRMSELTTIIEHYHINGGIPIDELNDVGVQNLYNARKLPVPVDEQLSIATNNSKRDIEARIRNNGEQCTHKGFDVIKICSNCRSRIE